MAQRVEDRSVNLVTADSPHTQRKYAPFLVEEKKADFLFYTGLNQPKLYEAIAGLEEGDWLIGF